MESTSPVAVASQPPENRLTALLARMTEIRERLRLLDPDVDGPAEIGSNLLPTGEAGSGQSASAFDALVQQAAARHDIDPDLIHAVIRAESDYDPNCVSHAGAMGLMQIMPDTARAFGVADPFDPAANIEAGTRELAGYLQRFPSVELALAAYNAGPGNVRKYGGIPPFRETQAYVPRVLRYWQGPHAE